MTTFLLIRHGAHVLGGHIIAGRSPEAVLSDLGQRRAEHTADRLKHLPIRAVYASPVVRARQTAEALARRIELDVRTTEALGEVDFGEWAGREIAKLKSLDRWKHWNAFRSGTRAPGGESMLEIQTRAVAEIMRLREIHPDECVALVSHGDVIKAALAYFLGSPLDLFLRIEIALASVSVVAVGDYGPWVLCVNNTGDEVQMPY